MGYGDYVVGKSVISRVYYVEGLGHNLFSVRQFCDFDLEVVFRKHSCYVQDTDGVDLIKGSRGSNLYTISVEDMMKSSTNLTTDSQITKLTEQVTNLQAQNNLFRAENDKVKHHYKELYDSIKITRAKHIEQVTALTAENMNPKAQTIEKVNSVSKDQVKPKVLARGKHAIDVEPIVPRFRNNRDAHLDYLRHLKESVETIRDIVEEAKVKTNVHVPPSTRVNSFPNASGSQTKSHIKTNRISPAKGVNKLPVEDQPRTNKSHLRTLNRVDSSSRLKRTIINLNLDSVCQTCNKCLTSSNHDMCVATCLQSVVATSFIHHNCNVVRKVKQVWKSKQGRTNRPLVFGFRLLKTYDGDRSRLMNFVKKFIGTVRFGNDHFGAIMDYEDYVIGNNVISRVYYMEGVGHNLFFVSQFCDSDLEVAFRKHSCYVQDTDGVELIKGSRGSNLYTISVEDMMKSSPICLLSKASKNKSWLWHWRLNHLNFGTINDLARKDLVQGLPRLKFPKDHLCSAFPITPQQNGVVERRNRTLVEAARTMLIFSKAPMFLWAEAVATACYIQNRSLIYTRHHKTSYELVHNKKQDLTFFRVFGALCYPTNDSEDLGKLQPTADIGIFVGYAPSRKGYQIYNKRTRRIMKTIQVQFDELTAQMAPVHLSTGPAPNFLTPGQIKPPRAERLVPPDQAVLAPVNSAGTPSSTTIDKDAPSPSISPSSSALQYYSLHQGIAVEPTYMEDHTVSPVDNNPFINVFAPEPHSEASSSGKY
nr:integrase, catalytic region, zinc finger, CCHC-type, peptidase aspartic, catalytic [Tanacetum cinerariifolium]